MANILFDTIDESLKTIPSPKPKAAATGVVKAISEVAPNYFYGTTTEGGTIGKSDQVDTSNRPLFAFRKPGDASTTTDPTRVATVFDPRKPQALTRAQYYNPRAEGLRDKYKKELGVAWSDELDHEIALALSGSNQRNNLRAIPKDQNRRYGTLEAKLAREVASGKKSLFDAQIEAAKAKGIDVPYTGLPEEKSFWEKFSDSVSSIADSVMSNSKGPKPAEKVEPIELGKSSIGKPSEDVVPGKPFSRAIEDVPIVGLLPKLGRQGGEKAAEIERGFKEQYTNPSPEELKVEEALGKPKNPIDKYITLPTYKGIFRTLHPALHPFAADVAEIQAVMEKGGIADQVKEGKIPSQFLDEIAVLQKTAPQIVGDTAQAVLSTYTPSLAGGVVARSAGAPVTKAVAGGLIEGGAVGLLFGGAQAASSGETDPAKLTEIILTNGAVGSLIGGITSGAIPASRDVYMKAVKIKDYLDTLPGKQGGYVRLGGADGEIPKELQSLAAEAKKYKSAEEFAKNTDNPLLVHHTGGAADTKSITDFSGVGEGNEINRFGPGLYLTESKDTAVAYSKVSKDRLGRGNKTFSGVLSPDAKILDLNGPLPPEARKIFEEFANENLQDPSYVPEDQRNRTLKSIDFAGKGSKIYDKISNYITKLPSDAGDIGGLFHQLNEKLEKAGYDGLRADTISPGGNKGGTSPTELVLFKPKKHLTDINDFYKEATKTKKPIKEIPVEQANDEYNELLKREDESTAKAVSEIFATNKTKNAIEQKISEQKLGLEFGREAIDNSPFKSLTKYANKRTGELPEVLGKKVTAQGKKTGIFAQRGDDIMKSLGIEDTEVGRAAFQDFRKQVDRQLKLEKELKEFVGDYRDKKKILEAVERKLRQEGRTRQAQINLIADMFSLEKKEVGDILKGSPDFRLMSDERFEGLLKEVRSKAADIYFESQARAQLEYTIMTKELRKLENLQKALKLPKIENMNAKQINEFNELLQTFKTGDEFLGTRQIETVRNTDLSGIKTKREALENLSKRTGVPVAELKTITAGEFDRFWYDTALAHKNPFYAVMVDDFNKAHIEGSLRFHELKKEMTKLVSDSRKSRPNPVMNRLAPVDRVVFEYMEATATDKPLVAKRMSPADMRLAEFMIKKYSEVRDYLVKKEVLKKYRSEYITHIKRGFLEAWREDGVFKGFLNAFKEMFDSYKQQEAYFNILDQKTGDVLPLEKFFKFSMKRTGNLVPTKNVARAFLSYMQTFEQKVALDSIVPKLDIYAHSLTSAKTTPRGLEFDTRLKRFVKEWINNKKGRVLNELVKPGGRVDWALRTGAAVIRMLDLGLNIPVGIASNVGEQISTYTGMGTKNYTTGLARFGTPRGRKILNKYDSFIGETLWKKLSDNSKTIGDKFGEVIYGLFSSASRRANAISLLGSMSKEEYTAGAISADRLAEIRREMGKFRSVEGAESIIGKTAIGGVLKQYKAWAVPILTTTARNLKKTVNMLRAGKNPLHSREFQELARATVSTAIVATASYVTYANLKDKKGRTFVEDIAFKAARDAFSLLSAMDPSLWLSVPRLYSFLSDLSAAVSDMTVAITTGDRTKEGEIPGLNKVAQTLTPKLVKQFMPSDSKKSDSPLPPLPKLNVSKTKLPPLPKLPKLPKAKVDIIKK